MLRRQFFTRTIGALVGVVCAPLLGKAKPLLPTGWPKPGAVDAKNTFGSIPYPVTNWTCRYESPLTQE